MASCLYPYIVDAFSFSGNTGTCVFVNLALDTISRSYCYEKLVCLCLCFYIMHCNDI